jgi:hypothetical protein
MKNARVDFVVAVKVVSHRASAEEGSWGHGGACQVLLAFPTANQAFPDVIKLVYGEQCPTQPDQFTFLVQCFSYSTLDTCAVYNCLQHHHNCQQP